MKIKAFADASFHREDRASYGIVILANDTLQELSGKIPESIPTNNIAELYAIYMAVEYVVENFPECTLVEVWNDSRTVVSMLATRRFLNRGKNYFYKQLIDRIDKLVSRKNVVCVPCFARIAKKKRHRKLPEAMMIKRCDRLAEKVFSTKTKRVARYNKHDGKELRP